MHSENEVVYLYLDDIIPNRFQPREIFDERALQELSMSIKEHGVIQPIIVRNIGDKYEIIAGERRYKASAMAGLTKIPAIIRNLDDKESSKVALLENLQRKDLNAIEEARTYQKILELDQMTQEELAKTMGKSQPAIANKIRLLSLPEEVQDALLKEKISERHARSLLTLESAEQQIKMMHEVINNRMTVRELDNEIKFMKNSVVTNEFSINDNITMESPRFILNPLPENDNELQEKNDVSIESNELHEDNTMSDLDYLLHLEQSPKPVTIEEQLNNILSEVPVTDKQESNIETDSEIETLSLEEEPINIVPTSRNDLKSAINNTRDFIKTLEKSGFVISTEEMDFENIYQITIKIDKNK